MAPSTREANAAGQRRHYEQKMAFITAHKAERGCARCDERDVRCLDLHHIDPSTKSAKLKRLRRLYKLPWSELVAEIAKREVLCANCHRKEHH